jgi:DNA-binding FadR family transcriptional regulator
MMCYNLIDGIHQMNRMDMNPIDLGSDLLNYIIESGLNPGERLPAISTLKSPEHLGISTSKVREQLEVARALGLVEVRSKTGTRLQEYTFTPAVRLSLLYALARSPQLFEQFSQLRVRVEEAFWQEACACLIDEDKQTLRDCVQEAREKLTGDWIRIPNQEHRTFHVTIFKRLGNPFVLGLVEAYWDAYHAVQLDTYSDYDYLRTVWDYHERTLDAICAGDYIAAQTAFVEHTKLIRQLPQMQGIQGDETADSDTDR